MSLKQQLLRKTRNLLYHHYRSTKQRYEQTGRALLRELSAHANPIADAPQITNRQTDDRWQSLRPVWVLSTGRTGTNSLTELLKLSPFVDAFHEPAPELFQFSFDYAMEQCDQATALSTLSYLRDELVFRSVRDGQIFVETNNRVTYLADLLLKLYPKSRFIHIYRNPYDFIRSGMRRKYYNGHMRDYARITPTAQDPSRAAWTDFSPLQKVAWNWAAINKRCLDFMDRLPDGQAMSFSSESLFRAELSFVHTLFDFVGSTACHPPASDIRQIMATKHNAQQEGRFSKPKEWDNRQIEAVNDIISPVATKLNYQLLSTADKGI